jgi:hypothetical protein
MPIQLHLDTETVSRLETRTDLVEPYRAITSRHGGIEALDYVILGGTVEIRDDPDLDEIDLLAARISDGALVFLSHEPAEPSNFLSSGPTGRSESYIAPHPVDTVHTGMLWAYDVANIDGLIRTATMKPPASIEQDWDALNAAIASLTASAAEAKTQQGRRAFSDAALLMSRMLGL